MKVFGDDGLVWGSMEVSGANIGVGDNGGNVGSDVPRPPSSSRPRPPPPSQPRPRQSTLPLPRMGCIQTGGDDTEGLMDGPREVDAS